MKKFYHFLMLLVLSVLLVACNSSGDSSKKEDKKTEESSKKSKKKKKSKKDKKDKDETDEADEEDETDGDKKGKKKKSNSDGEITLKNYTAVDNENYSITINDIETDAIYGYTINVTIENKTADKNYAFNATGGSVDGLETLASLYSEVAAGKKASTAITFTDLSKYGLEKYTDIELEVSVSDMDSEEYNFATENIHLYPYGEDKASKFTYEQKDTDKVVMDNEYVQILYIGADKEDFWGYAIGFYVVNKTDKSLTIDANDVSVDGYMADPYFIENISPGKNAFFSMSWSDSTFQQSNIDENNISNIEFKLDVYDSDDYSSPHFATETITINP